MEGEKEGEKRIDSGVKKETVSPLNDGNRVYCKDPNSRYH